MTQTFPPPEEGANWGITISLAPDVRDSLRALAQEHERSLSGELRWILRRYAEDPERFEIDG